MRFLRHALTRRLAVGAITAGCSLAAGAADLKVGVIAALSGPNASLGVPYAKGVEAALTYSSEVNGRKIKLLILDDGSDPTAAGRNARKLVNEEKVDVLIGSTSVPAAIATAQVAREAGVPMIAYTPIAINPAENKWVFSVAQPAPLMIDTVVRRMKKDGVKTVGYIGFSDAWGDLVYDALLKAAEKEGIKVLANERYARADASVTGQVLKLIARKPDAIMTGGSGTAGALPFIALRDRGFKGKIYGQYALINPDFVRVVGAAGQGAIMSTGPVVVAEQLPDTYPTKRISADFTQAYKKTHNEPNSGAYSAYSFDAWLVFLDAASRVQQEPGTAQYRSALRDAIASSKEVVGTQGVFNFQDGALYGVDERASVIVELDEGQWTLVH